MSAKITDELYMVACAFEGKEIGSDFFRKIIDLKQGNAVLEAVEAIEILYGELRRLFYTANLILENHKYRIGDDYGKLVEAIYAANLVLKKYERENES
jgi:hypothetical protein